MLAGGTSDSETKATLLLNEARCCRLLGEIRKARECLSLARKIAPQTEGLLYFWEEDAILHWHEGDRKTALGIFDRLQADYGQLLRTQQHSALDARIQGSRGMLLAELGRYSEAAPLLERAMASESAEIDKDGILHDLGLCYLQLGRRAVAKETLERLLREGVRADLMPSTRLYLGDVYFHEGAYAKAMREFEWCLAHAGEHKIPTPYLYRWLAVTAGAMGMKEDAERYDKLAAGKIAGSA